MGSTTLLPLLRHRTGVHAKASGLDPEAVYGPRQLDKECFRALVDAEEPLTVDEIGEFERKHETEVESPSRAQH